MKINKEKLVQIINEEVDLMKKHQHRGQYMDHPDKEGKMAMNQLEDIAKYSMELHQMLQPYGESLQLEAWVQNKLSVAREYIGKIKHYLEHELNVADNPVMEE
tara:strand:+ start:949 stop:1257 length:309 start_codon:yes stop_codon:yes gene_type:complete